MARSSKNFGTGIVAGVLVTLLGLLLIALLVAYTGAYNVAATKEHRSFVRWLFETTFHNSVTDRASDLTAPTDVSQSRIQAGAGAYKAMCEHCHGAPGVDRADWAQGMLPRPPYLYEAAVHWEVNEVFWLAKHGVKMSGMPAFGPTHSDEHLWNIALFVSQLPAMTDAEYAQITSGSTHEH